MAMAFAQPAQNLVTKVKNAQSRITAISYTLLRSDSFVTGTTRIIRGKASIKPLPGDTIFGFAFRGKRDDLNSYSVYDGRMGFDVDETRRSYTTSVGQSIPHMLGLPGGQVIFEDMVRLDTSGASRFEVSEDQKHFYLTIFYPDIKEYDVEHRYKFLAIDKKLMIPVRMRKYQETLGKVQHLNYEASEIKLNGQAVVYNYSAPPFLENYKQEVPATGRSLSALKDKLVPEFSLVSFSGEKVNTATFAGKVVLLDFWEVWCGPCIASMPKVDALYESYKEKGLQVYGITNETEQLESARKLIAKKQVNFPNLIGNKNMEKNFKVSAIPLYILIDRKGMIKFVSQGFSEKIEEEIKLALQ
jgi:thiol-disulfide isomerase/thioredoxin